MTRKLCALLAGLLAAGLILAACGPAVTPTAAPATSAPPSASEQPTTAPTAGATEAPTQAAATEIAIVGFTTSLTGSLNVESTRQANGFKLWMDQVNAAGGITLADGTVITFDSKSYDDESDKVRIQELYTKLATEDHADFLISPYSSGLADAAAVIAEQNGKLMITTGAASDSTYEKGYTLVYQAYTPASRYLTGALDVLAAADPSAKKLAIIHENDKFSTDVAAALTDYATGKGYEIAVNEGYDTGTTDFAPLINKIPVDVDAIMGGGHFTDGQQFAKALFDKGVNAKFISLLVAPPEPSFADIGDAAFGVVGPSQWEPLAAFTPDYGPTGKEFVDAYMAAYGEEPSYHSAGGYVAGLLLQKAIEDAGSLDTDKIKAALDALDLTTFFGHTKFDTTADAHGLQIGHDMVYIQWQKDASGNLVKQVIWPQDAKTAELVYPIH